MNPGTSKSPLAAFMAIGIWTAVIYLLILFYINQGYLIDMQTAPKETPMVSCVLWFGLVMLIFLYLKGSCLLKNQNHIHVRHILGFALLFSLIGLFIRPFNSTDLMSYMKEGWAQYHYGLNIYVHPVAMVSHWRQDPMFYNADWFKYVTPYGFLFALIEKTLAWFGQGNYMATMFLFKGLNIIAHLGTALLVYACARSLGLKNPLLATYLYAWSPLIILYHIANGHNDILMGCLTCLALYFLIKKQWLWVLPVLMGATFIKYAPALSFLLAALFLWKQAKPKALVYSALLALLLLLGMSFPYWTHSFKSDAHNVVSTVATSHNSLHTAILYTLYDFGSALGPFKQLYQAAILQFGLYLKALLYGGFFMMIFHVTRQFRKTESPSEPLLIDKMVFLQFVLIVFISAKYWPWYIGMFFPMALLLEESHWLRNITIILSLTNLFYLVLVGDNQYLPTNGIAMTIAPLLLYWLWRSIQRKATPTTLQDASVGPLSSVPSREG